MRAVIGFAAACALAALAPAFGPGDPPPAPTAEEPSWPARFEGHELERVPLEPEELELERELPGHVARFRVKGQPGSLVVRFIASPSRKVHPARHCYRGAGYTISALPAWLDGEGRAWGRFSAEDSRGRGHEVRELVVGPAGSWPDIDSWYWSVSRRSTGPWWAFTRSTPLVPKAKENGP